MRAIARWMYDQLFNGVVNVEKNGKLLSGLNGLRARCAGEQVIGNAANDQLLTLDLLNAAIDADVGQGNGAHAFMNKAMLRQLKNLILAVAGGAAVADVAGTVPVYEGVQLHAVGDKLENTSTLDFS